MRRLASVGAAALAVAASAAAAATHTVVVDGFRFEPAELTVARGDTVVWVNRDAVAHTATAAGVFDSGVVAPAKSASLTLARIGRHDYVCTLHPTMKARIVVR